MIPGDIWPPILPGVTQGYSDIAGRPDSRRNSPGDFDYRDPGEDQGPTRAALLKTFKPDGEHLVTRDDVRVADRSHYGKLRREVPFGTGQQMDPSDTFP